MREEPTKLGSVALLALAFLLGATCTPSATAQNPALKQVPTLSSDVKTKKFAPVGEPSWAPPDVDTTDPPVDARTPCSLPDVLKSAGARAQELINSLPQFTATERMQHYELEKSGAWSKPETVAFEYLVEMKKIRPGMLVMEETRDGRQSLDKFPAHLATLGLPAVAMVFHPYYVGEYNMKCEGLGAWDGRPAWQIYFQQRPDKYPRLRGYRIKDQGFAIKLKGRAWLDAETFQPLHIETDLLEPVPQINLLREHLAVDYRPVHFRKENEDLWLQKSAEIFMDYRGHRYRRVHTFSDFLLFSVDVNQKDATPKEGSQH